MLRTTSLNNHHLPSIHPLPLSSPVRLLGPFTKYLHTAPAIVSYIKQPSSSSSSSSSSIASTNRFLLTKTI
ncbi:unnamed protein product [Lactuca virosa]|uniref:Uncharacterized protein n=1 Tax=Lactuca virosa TaxID=75947 RepID=A0AAU9NV33_9ASTR|nr:unnamed protein product [Lactuca virosa]